MIEIEKTMGPKIINIIHFHSGINGILCFILVLFYRFSLDVILCNIFIGVVPMDKSYERTCCLPNMLCCFPVVNICKELLILFLYVRLAIV